MRLENWVESTRLPFIIKGIMTVDDALMAVESGASAIIVSNHGGRVLDYTPGTCEVLPDIAKSVKGKITILVDGGVRTGVDVVKDAWIGVLIAVLMGRPFVTASFGGGLDGVEFFIEKVRNELL
uniref:Dehydrogenase n=1 Tax=Clostridioides difficile TaxID=1496 RepID=A0A381ICZ2_CLODI|nr:dehydrogenase [Clostridioides difficile]